MVFTHEGYEVGCDARSQPGYKRKVILRETKLQWISKDGRRYSKKHYGRISGEWPMYRLDLETLKLTHNVEVSGADRRPA